MELLKKIKLPSLKISHKGIILVSVPLIFELIFLATLTYLLRQAEVEVQRQVRSKAIISQANTLSKLFYDAGVAMGGYSITKSPLFSDRYDKIVRQIPQDLLELKTLVGDNPRQQEILSNLHTITVTGLKILGEAKAAIDDNRVDVAQFRARHMYKEIRSLADRLQDELRGLTEDERKIESESPEAQNRSRARLKMFLVIGVVFNVLLAFGLALFFSRGISSRLGILTDNSFRLARGQPLNPPLVGADEIAHLDGVFHSMADALAEATRKERAVIENAVDVICSIDMDGKFVAVSPASYENWQYRPDELMGRRFIEIIVPEDIPETIKSVRAIRAEKGTASFGFENRVRRKDGTSVNVLWSAYWSEKERSMFCVAHDITQRKLVEEAIKASEARIRSIIDHMLVGLILITPKGIIESVNPRTQTIFGYKAEELVGRHLLYLFADSKLYSENDPNDCSQFMESVTQRALGRIGEFDCLRKDGEDFPIEISLSEFNQAEGMRYMANILDVSERKEVERLKKEFVSTVSHELRTPLTSIRGSLTLLSVGAMGQLPEQAKKVVTIAERNTIRLISLINDILDIEKLEAGKLDMVFDNISLTGVLERSVQAVNTFAENNGITLEILPTQSQVYADGDRIVQVLVNLMSNAVKFSPKGQTVTVSCEEGPGFIEVKVIDRGRGIPESHKNKLFQRFQQVEASDSRKKGGTGLGLAICKGIVEQHGGTIGVDSEEGKGSVFWFKLPPAQAQAAKPAAPTADSAPVAQTAAAPPSAAPAPAIAVPASVAGAPASGAPASVPGAPAPGAPSVTPAAPAPSMPQTAPQAPPQASAPSQATTQFESGNISLPENQKVPLPVHQAQVPPPSLQMPPPPPPGPPQGFGQQGPPQGFGQQGPPPGFGQAGAPQGGPPPGFGQMPAQNAQPQPPQPPQHGWAQPPGNGNGALPNGVPGNGPPPPPPPQSQSQQPQQPAQTAQQPQPATPGGQPPRKDMAS